MQNPYNIILVIYLSALLLLLLTVSTVAVLFQLQKRKILHSRQIEKVQHDFQKSLLNAQLEIQETTLLNIAQEIHDNIGLGLTLAKLNINTIEPIDMTKSAVLLDNSRELIGKAILDLSDLSKSINSEVIVNVGLISSLENEVQRIKRNAFQNILVQVDGESYHLEAKKEVLLFRIIQESLNNILKHAKATQIIITLKFSDPFVLSIEDNGQGFSLDEVRETKKMSSGLTNIKNRVDLMDGQLEIKSKKQTGTYILIKIPKYTSYANKQ